MPNRCNATGRNVTARAGSSQAQPAIESNRGLMTGGGRLSSTLRLGDVGTVLEMVLENLCLQSRGHALSLGFDRADHFSATDNLCSREPGNFWRQHQADLQLSVRVEKFLGLQQQSGAADVLRGACAPAPFTKQTT